MLIGGRDPKVAVGRASISMYTDSIRTLMCRDSIRGVLYRGSIRTIEVLMQIYITPRRSGSKLAPLTSKSLVCPQSSVL